MREDFCAFILTHGRPDKIRTLRSLNLSGYTGKVFIVIDDEDSTGPEYKKLFGDQVLVFSKDEVGRYTDQFDNFKERRAIFWARNACWDLAKKIGCRYFIQLDDDYTSFLYRKFGKRTAEQEVDTYHGWTIRSLDAVFEAMIEFLETTPSSTICMSQGGDHFGGVFGKIDIRLRRKAMNSFICDTTRPFLFRGRVNEDVNTYVSLGNVGKIFWTYMPVQLNQLQTQSNTGGMTDLYLDSGTYLKSFYTVMAAPSCTKIRTMGRTDRRLHHSINWRHAVPLIISEKFCK